MGRRGHRLFLGGGGVVRSRGVIKEESPDFRSPEVGISVEDEQDFSIFRNKLNHSQILL